MDKLEPLIRNRFWILAGLILPLAMYGFYSANGQLKAATKARVEALTTTKNGVSAGMEPNTDYINKLQVINGFLEGSVDDAIVDIWRHQQARMTWPPLVADKIPKDFLGPFDQQVPFIYKSAYEEIFQKLQERIQPVRPIDPMTMTMPGNRPSANKVVLPNQKVILAANLPQAIFPQFGLSSEQMWDAQIDVWMTTLLLDAIVKMNQEKESVTESVIRRLDILQLVGGSGEPQTSDTASPGGDMGGMMGGEMGGGAVTTGPKISTEIRFNPAQEFGPATDGAAGGGDMSAMMDAGPSGATAAPPKRYIGDIEANPFLERGFYMSVIIQQSKIADFVAELVNSDWPVQVKRFQVGVNPYRTALTSNTDGGPGMMNDFSMNDPSMSFGGPSSFEGSSSFGSPSSGGGFGMGDFGGTGQNATLRPNIFATNLPPFASAAMNHPDLVRLDLCGVITMYKQPTEVMVALEARKAAAAEAAANATPMETPAAPMEATTPEEAAPKTPEPASDVPTDGAATPPSPPAPIEPAPATSEPAAAAPPQ